MPEHYPLQVLYSWQKGQLNPDEETKLRHHLESCHACMQNSQLVSLYFQQPAAGRHRPATAAKHLRPRPEMTCSEVVGSLDRYVAGELSREKGGTMAAHLASCRSCQQNLALILRASSTPLSSREQQQLEELPLPQVSDHVQEVLRLVPPASQGLGRRGWQISWPHIADRVLDYVPARVAIAAVLVATVIGIWLLRPEHRYARAVEQSMAQLVEQHAIYYREVPRPAGGYHSTDVLEYMDGEHENQPEEAETRALVQTLHQALEQKSGREAAMHVLAQFYLWNGSDQRADSLLALLQSSTRLAAPALNDRGVVFFRRARFDSAAVYFQRAIEVDPGLEEALYNLAIAQTKLGDLKAAQKSWNRYLDRDEVPSDWRDAAQDQLQTVEASMK